MWRICGRAFNELGSKRGPGPGNPADGHCDRCAALSAGANIAGLAAHYAGPAGRRRGSLGNSASLTSFPNRRQTGEIEGRGTTAL